MVSVMIDNCNLETSNFSRKIKFGVWRSESLRIWCSSCHLMIDFHRFFLFFFFVFVGFVKLNLGLWNLAFLIVVWRIFLSFLFVFFFFWVIKFCYQSKESLIADFWLRLSERYNLLYVITLKISYKTLIWIFISIR